MSQKIVLSTQEAKEKLKAGEALENVSIDRLAMIKTEWDTPIQIVDCEIGTLDFNKAIFHQNVTIRRCKIEMLVLSETIFEQKCDFKKSRISRGRIQRANLQGPVNFADAKLAFSSFHKSIFGDSVDFSRVTFTGDATFTEAHFKGPVKFIHSKFQAQGMFGGTTWEDKVDLKHIHVEKDLELSDATFKDQLLLNGAVVQLSIHLMRAHLEGKTDFSNVSVGRNISLSGVTLGENQGFRFLNANTNSIILEREIVEGHVWPEHKSDHLAAAKEYGFLRTAFEKINRFDDEDWAYYQFKRNQRKGQPLSMNPFKLLARGIEYLFLDIGCGYGTSPFRTLGVCATLIVFFAVFYFFGIQVPKGVTYGFSSHALNQIMHAFYTSLIAFSGNLADTNTHGAFRIFAMAEYMLGFVFMGLFVVAFSRKVIR